MLILEDQGNRPQNADYKRSKQDRADAGAGGVTARTGDAGDLQRAEHENEAARQTEQKAGFGFLTNQLLELDKPDDPKWNGNHPPDNRPNWRQETFHDVHLHRFGKHRVDAKAQHQRKQQENDFFD
jgi:hypothetical protein